MLTWPVYFSFNLVFQNYTLLMCFEKEQRDFIIVVENELQLLDEVSYFFRSIYKTKWHQYIRYQSDQLFKNFLLCKMICLQTWKIKRYLVQLLENSGSEWAYQRNIWKGNPYIPQPRPLLAHPSQPWANTNLLSFSIDLPIMYFI